jgi:PIN domain nuclease of toxin-antitoxin system
MQEQMAFQMLDFPASARFHSERLPPIHRDPIDRMLVAHAIEANLVLVTADLRMRQYPVQTLW